MRPALEVADIFRRCGPHYRQTHADALGRAQRRAMSAIELCRTAALGGHVEQCDTCGHERITYNSCRHRACPKCQSLARAHWLERRRAELLPALRAAGFTVDHSEAGLYLWATHEKPCRDTVDWFARRGILVAPGEFYGPRGANHVRIALTATDERIAAAVERLLSEP